MRTHRAAAFTLVEMLIATLVGSVLGGIIYVVASEGLTSFARNASLNRGYSEARSALSQINSFVQTAGQDPTKYLVNASGVPVATGVSQAEGVRFYRYGAAPAYQIPSGKSSDSSLVINFSAAQASNGGTTSPVAVGDLATIPLIGFQGTVTSVTSLTKNADGSGKVTLNFAVPINTIGSATSTCQPPLKSVTSFAFQAKNGTTPAVYYSCVVYRQVAFITVPNDTKIGGAQLRYYPQAMSNVSSGGACGGLAAFNSATAFNNPNNYSVIANISTTVTDATLTPLKPFMNPDSTSVLKVVLCAEGPDYNNRNLGTSNTYSLMQSSMGSRSPLLLQQ